MLTKKNIFSLYLIISIIVGVPQNCFGGADQKYVTGLKSVTPTKKIIDGLHKATVLVSNKEISNQNQNPEYAGISFSILKEYYNHEFVKKENEETDLKFTKTKLENGKLNTLFILYDETQKCYFLSLLNKKLKLTKEQLDILFTCSITGEDDDEKLNLTNEQLLILCGMKNNFLIGTATTTAALLAIQCIICLIHTLNEKYPHWAEKLSASQWKMLQGLAWMLKNAQKADIIYSKYWWVFAIELATLAGINVGAHKLDTWRAIPR